MHTIIFIVFFIICIILYLNNTGTPVIKTKKCKKRVKFCDPIIKSVHFY